MCDELSQYVKLIPFLGETLGNTFEACLFDLTVPGYPVVASVNSHEDTQDKVRTFVHKAVSSRQTQTKGYFANRPIEIDYSKLLKSSVFFIYSAEGKPVGALCLNLRCDLFMKMTAFANSMLQFNTEDLETEEPRTELPRVADQEISLDVIAQMVDEFGVEPGRFSQQQRLENNLDLYVMGVFELKGSVAKAAEELQISPQSVYRYLTKIKKARDW